MNQIKRSYEIFGLKHMQGIFITGTDTGIGKTYVGCKIAAELVSRNIAVIPRKPVESGCQLIDQQLHPDDALNLQQASASPESLQQICPWRFQAAISPARAARLTGQSLSLEQLTRACVPETDTEGFLLVEGAGGFYSPICDNGLNADLARELHRKLNLPLLLVSENRLGCINQTLLALQAIEHYQLPLKGVVLSRPNPSSDRQDHAAELAEYISLPVFSTDNPASIHQLVDLLVGA